MTPSVEVRSTTQLLAAVHEGLDSTSPSVVAAAESLHSYLMVVVKRRMANIPAELHPHLQVLEGYVASKRASCVSAA